MVVLGEKKASIFFFFSFLLRKSVEQKCMGNVVFFCTLPFSKCKQSSLPFITTKGTMCMCKRMYIRSIQIVSGYFLMQKRRFEMISYFVSCINCFNSSFSSSAIFACVYLNHIFCARLSAIVSADVSILFRMYVFN